METKKVKKEIFPPCSQYLHKKLSKDFFRASLRLKMRGKHKETDREDRSLSTEIMKIFPYAHTDPNIYIYMYVYATFHKV